MHVKTQDTERFLTSPLGVSETVSGGARVFAARGLRFLPPLQPATPILTIRPTSMTQWRFWGFHFVGHWGGDTFIWGGTQLTLSR